LDIDIHDAWPLAEPEEGPPLVEPSPKRAVSFGVEQQEMQQEDDEGGTEEDQEEEEVPDDEDANEGVGTPA
jgi:hypothetical protein